MFVCDPGNPKKKLPLHPRKGFFRSLVELQSPLLFNLVFYEKEIAVYHSLHQFAYRHGGCRHRPGAGRVSLSLLKRFHPSVVGMFLIMILFFIYPTNFALTASGTLSEMGVTLTMVGLDVVAFLVGLCFGFLMKRFAAQMKYIAPLGFAAGNLGKTALN